ncbi:MAG: hypothetical protein J2P35_01015 [Actinobacteria bacterium]|nr:hypothetical protein [Actinomycetota bacterium]
MSDPEEVVVGAEHEPGGDRVPHAIRGGQIDPLGAGLVHQLTGELMLINRSAYLEGDAASARDLRRCISGLGHRLTRAMASGG